MPKWIDPLTKFDNSRDILSQFGMRCRLYKTIYRLVCGRVQVQFTNTLKDYYAFTH